METTPAAPPKQYRKSTDAIKLVMAGIDPAEALKMVNFKKTISAMAVHELKQKVRKYSLSAPSTVSLASKQIKRILKNDPRQEDHAKVSKDGQVIEYTDNVYPTDSNILAAASLVYDRYEPVASQAAPGQAIQHIDLSSYRVQINVNNSPKSTGQDIIEIKDE